MHEYFLQHAYHCALGSPDPSSQNGALVTDQAMLDGLTGRVISGRNEFPAGVRSTSERLVRPRKYRYIEHAERGAVYAAARAGMRTLGATMVCPWAACCDCARSIICAGIKTLVVHKERMDMTPEHWRADVDDALNMLSEAAVEIIHFEGPVRGALPILADGKLWSPETLSFVGTE